MQMISNRERRRRRRRSRNLCLTQHSCSLKEVTQENAKTASLMKQRKSKDRIDQLNFASRREVIPGAKASISNNNATREIYLCDPHADSGPATRSHRLLETPRNLPNLHRLGQKPKPRLPCLSRAQRMQQAPSTSPPQANPHNPASKGVQKSFIVSYYTIV